MSRVGLLFISVCAGAVLAVALSFAASAVVNSSGNTPATQTFYNYGNR